MIYTLLPLLLEAGGRAGGQPGPRQQTVLHPAGAVRGGGVSPLLARAVSPLLLGPPQGNILLAAAEAALGIAMEYILVISCDVNK